MPKKSKTKKDIVNFRPDENCRKQIDALIIHHTRESGFPIKTSALMRRLIEDAYKEIQK